MVHLIDELKVLEGVMGACLYHPQEGVLASNLPAIFKQERLENIGRQLLKLQSAGRMSLAGGKDLQLCFEELMIVAREIEGGVLVFVLCEASFNRQLLVMPLGLLEEDYSRQPTAPEVSADPASTPEPASESQSVGGGRFEIGSAAGAELVAELTAELSLQVGPMAEMIVEDVVDDWQQQGQSNVADLVELICDEVGDAAKSTLFRQSAAPIIYKWDLKKG